MVIATFQAVAYFAAVREAIFPSGKMGELKRGERLQIMLTDQELNALDDWRFSARMPSRAAAIRELLKRGLAAAGFTAVDGNSKSRDYGVVESAGVQEAVDEK
jgi:hypothetical protein